MRGDGVSGAGGLGGAESLSSTAAWGGSKKEGPAAWVPGLLCSSGAGNVARGVFSRAGLAGFRDVVSIRHGREQEAWLRLQPGLLVSVSVIAAWGRQPLKAGNRDQGTGIRKAGRVRSRQDAGVTNWRLRGSSHVVSSSTPLRPTAVRCGPADRLFVAGIKPRASTGPRVARLVVQDSPDNFPGSQA